MRCVEEICGVLNERKRETMITCDCSCIAGDGPAVSSSGFVMARKEHKCCECGGVIPSGEKYEVYSGCWDGSWGRYKTCFFCVTIRDLYCPGGYVFGELVETIRECLGFDYSTDPAMWEDEPREPPGWQLRERDEQKIKKIRTKEV